MAKIRILVNYNKEESNYLPVLQYHLKARNIEAIASSSAYTLGELLTKATVANCDAILLCNPYTLASILPEKNPSLDNYRGSVLRFSKKIVVCNSLAHTHTVPYGSWLLGKDLDKLLHLNEQSEFTFTVLDATHKFGVAFRTLKDCIFLAYDIETKTYEKRDDDGILITSDTVITCCSWTGLTPSGTLETFVLPFVDFGEDHWLTNEDYGKAIQLMRDINKLDMPKAMHNGMYDSLHSIVYHAEPHNFIFDTMAMAHSEFSELPKTLDFVASITLNDYVQWKYQAELSSKEKDILSYWSYNGKDTWYTARILLHYLKHLPAYAKKNYITQFKFVYPFLYCAFEGIAIDNVKRLELREAASTKLQEALAKLRIMFADNNFNPASPKQVATYIYDVFGAADPKIGYKKVNGKRIKITRGTNEKNLLAIGEQHPILLRVTSALLTYRENAKAISTYFDFDQLNNRLLYNLNPFGTDTNRASCNSSSFWVGTQVQNIPPYAKPFLIADEGYELVEMDNSQSEARCTAYLSQETSLIAALENPAQDFYKSLGTLFFGIPYAEVTKEFRNVVLKKIVHGTNYMMGSATFIENAGAQNLIDASPTLGITITMDKNKTGLREGEMTLLSFGTHLLDAYHKPFPRVRQWYQETKSTIASTHKLVSPLGHTRHFFGDILKDHNMLRSAVAHGPQNLSVHILNIGLWKVWKLVKKLKGALRLKAQIHDSIFAQYLIGRDDIRKDMYDCLQNPVVIHGRTLKIPVDYKTGSDWGNMIEHKEGK